MSFEDYLRRSNDNFVSKFLFCMTAFTGAGLCLGILILMIVLRVYS